MEREKILEELADCLVKLKGFDDIKRLTRKALDAGLAPYEIISKGLAKGLNIVGNKYEQGEYFLSELIMSAALMKEAMKIVKPLLKSKVDTHIFSRIAMGTVRGDLHDIGKNIVVAMLEAAGFEVIDLGVDVPTKKFIEAAQKYDAKILGMSALLSSTLPEMTKVINALKDAKLGKVVKVMVGGTPLDEKIAEEMGADAYGKDAIEAVRIAKELFKVGD